MKTKLNKGKEKFQKLFKCGSLLFRFQSLKMSELY